MLLWRRNLKFYHYSKNTLPVDKAVIWRVVGLVLSILVPYFIAYAMGRFWAEYETTSIETDAVFNEAVLLLHKQTEPYFKAYRITPKNNFKESEDLGDYQLSVRDSTGQLEVEISLLETDVSGVELYSYVTLSGFQPIPQLLFSQSSSLLTASKIELSSDLRVIQRNGKLYSALDETSDAYLPSTFAALWDPPEAIKNATRREIRVDLRHRSVRWMQGAPTGQTVISVRYDHSGYLETQASPTMADQLYRAIIQYIYFVIPTVWLYVQLTDFLHSSGTFPATIKIEKVATK